MEEMSRRQRRMDASSKGSMGKKGLQRPRWKW